MIREGLKIEKSVFEKTLIIPADVVEAASGLPAADGYAGKLDLEND